MVHVGGNYGAPGIWWKLNGPFLACSAFLSPASEKSKTSKSGMERAAMSGDSTGGYWLE